MGVQVADGAGSGRLAGIDVNLNLEVRTPVNATQTGFAAASAIRDTGSITGSVNAGTADITPDNRLRIGGDTILFHDRFNYVAQNTATWKAATSTETVTFSGGYVTLNAGSSVATGAYAWLSTYRYFPLYSAGGVGLDIEAAYAVVPEANASMYIGVGIPGTTNAEPTDGAYFRFNSAGQLNCVVNYNGTINTSATIASPPAANAVARYRIFVFQQYVEFWINGVLVAVVQNNTSTATSTYLGAGALFFGTFNGGTSPALAQQIKVYNVNVFQLDLDTSLPWAYQMAGMGQMAYQGQDGNTMGTTALFANSANPAAAVPTNTSAALGSGLGGNFWETASIAVNTDGIISSYQNPAAAVGVQPRNLVITGVTIDSVVQTVLVGGPFVNVWSLAFGHTSVSLATGEGANAKAPRRIALGHQVLAATAAVGTQPNVIRQTFAAPIVVQPGEFIATVMKNIGTVGTGGTIAHTITFDGYFE